MASRVEKIPEIPNLDLGEGPHWDGETQSLYFVDIFGKSIHKYIPSTGQHNKVVFDVPVSIIIPVEGKRDQFVVSLERDIVIITWDGNSDKPSKIQKIAEVDKGTQNRTNDGKCDPSGRLWVGSMGPEPENGHVLPQSGSLFSLTNRTLNTHVTNVGISNGLAWNAQLKKFYYIDSFAYSVDAFNFDMVTGSISDRTTVFTLSKHGIGGFPDGMTIDVDGNLWVAVFNGYKVIKIDPRKPQTLLQTIDIPAKQVTSVAWGGIDLDVLYVTTASFTVDGEELLPPNHGALFRVTNLGTKGFPGDSFDLK